jgi:diguanylate cyclase (GGDEF)-like protein
VHRALWRVYLGVGLIVVVGYYAVPMGIAADVLYVAIGLSCVAAICVGVRIHQPARRSPWYVMAAGQLLWTIGDAVDSWYVDVSKTSVFPSAADAFYLAAYPILAAALVLLIRRRRTGRDTAGLLDSAIVTAGLGVLSWVLLARPTVTEAHLSIAASAVELAYPVADILLIGLLIRLVTTPGGRTPAFRLLMAAVALLVFGDTAADIVDLASASTHSFDFLWLLSYLCWGAAALHPSMRTLSDPAPDSVLMFSSRRLVVMTVATLVAPGTLAVELMLNSRIDGWAIVAGSVILILLVVARMNLAIDHIVTANRQRQELQDDLAYQATHDSLTNVPNRAQALRLIQGALYRAQRSGSIIGLLFVDLDYFKVVNDRFGHATGDAVLCAAAEAMKQQVRAGDVVARLGGDEFVILLEAVDSQASGVEVAERVVAAIRAAGTSHRGAEVSIGASIGVAFSMDGGTDADRLLAEADAAVYRAKSCGRGRVEVFDESLRSELYERANFETAVRAGLRDGEFLLHYQPIVDVRTQLIRGYEALIRWVRPGVGLVSPDQFIPTAEASKLICEIDRWVLDEALRQLAEWERSGAPGAEQLTIAVNISGVHISDRRIVDDVCSALATSGVAADRLVLEITETVLIDEPLAIRHLEILRELGVSVSIDDFGTGYNSIVKLQHLPVDGIKIDRSFLSSTHPAAGRLLALIVQAAHAFGLPVVAEGVENSEQLSALQTVACESAQGFLFARPMTAQAVEQSIAEGDRYARADGFIGIGGA